MTRIEINIPNLGGLESFVSDWTEAAKTEENLALAEETVYELMGVAYFGESGQLNLSHLESWLFEPKQLEEELKELRSQSWIRRVFNWRKIRNEQSELVHYQESYEKDKQRIQNMKKKYDKERKPYEDAALKLASNLGISEESVHREMLKRRSHAYA